MTALKNQSFAQCRKKTTTYKSVKCEFDEIICSMGQQDVLSHIERLFESWMISLDNGNNWKDNYITYIIYHYLSKAFVQKDYKKIMTIFFYADNEVVLLEIIEIMYECHLANIDDNDFVYGKNNVLYRLCKQLKELLLLAAKYNNA